MKQGDNGRKCFINFEPFQFHTVLLGKTPVKNCLGAQLLPRTTPQSYLETLTPSFYANNITCLLLLKSSNKLSLTLIKQDHKATFKRTLYPHLNNQYGFTGITRVSRLSLPLRTKNSKMVCVIMFISSMIQCFLGVKQQLNLQDGRHLFRQFGSQTFPAFFECFLEILLFFFNFFNASCFSIIFTVFFGTTKGVVRQHNKLQVGRHRC